MIKLLLATQFDRDLAATKDFVEIEGDKAIYFNEWSAGQSSEMGNGTFTYN